MPLRPHRALLFELGYDRSRVVSSEDVTRG